MVLGSRSELLLGFPGFSNLLRTVGVLVVVLVVVVVVVSGRVDRNYRAERGALGGGGTGLVGPGVGGEPGGEPQVLTGAVPGGDVAPASSGAVHALTVTLSIRKYLTN